MFAVGDLLDAPDKLLRLWENMPKVLCRSAISA